MTLLSRIEAAGEGEQRELLERTFYALNDAPDYGTDERKAWCVKSARFHRFIDAEAYLDAAMMLVPEGWVLRNLAETPIIVQEEHTGDIPLPAWNATLLRQDCAGYRNRSRFREAFAHGEAATPALALAAAAIRAKEAGDALD